MGKNLVELIVEDFERLEKKSENLNFDEVWEKNETASYCLLRMNGVDFGKDMTDIINEAWSVCLNKVDILEEKEKQEFLQIIYDRFEWEKNETLNLNFYEIWLKAETKYIKDLNQKRILKKATIDNLMDLAYNTLWDKTFEGFKTVSNEILLDIPISKLYTLK